MSPLDPEYEKVLNFSYENMESPTGIGVNEIRDQFPFSNEHVYTLVKRLEVQEFITAIPGYPRGTLVLNLRIILLYIKLHKEE